MMLIAEKLSGNGVDSQSVEVFEKDCDNVYGFSCTSLWKTIAGNGAWAIKVQNKENTVKVFNVKDRLIGVYRFYVK